MASSIAQPTKKRICSLCAGVLWFDLPPEDVGATAHHKSGKALEQSAQSCILCDMILHAAISNYRDSQGVRHGKGYWRQFDRVKLNDGSDIKDMMYVKEMGANCPNPGTPDFSQRRSRPLIMGLPAGAGFYRKFSTTVILPTSILDSNGHPIEDDKALSQLEALTIGNPADSLPVWLYGNFWADSKPKENEAQSHLRLMGIGARFGSSPMPSDAFGSNPGEISLRGSAIGISTSDGECSRYELGWYSRHPD